MNYDDFPAGPELDRLVAEKVMGWRVDPNDNHVLYSPAVRIIDPHERLEDRWSPSKNIAHAWEVVERIISTWPMTVRMPHSGSGWAKDMTWNARIEHGSDIADFWDANAETAPLAICRAALKAVGA